MAKKKKKVITKKRIHLYLEGKEINKMDQYAEKHSMSRSVFAQLLMSAALKAGITIKVSKITITKPR